jgi:hypothetical protein
MLTFVEMRNFQNNEVRSITQAKSAPRDQVHPQSG